MKDELTTEQKLAQSTGNDTTKFSQELEDEADALIKQAYGGGDDNTDEDDKTGADDDTGKETDEDGDTDNEDDVKKVIDPEIQNLLGQLSKSEKRVKDTRADHTRGRQELKEANSRTLELEDTVFKLKTQMELLQNAQTSKQEAKTEKAVEKTTGALADQIAVMEKLDPDIAAAMKPIVESIFGQIDTMKNDLATDKEDAKNKAIEDANDAHFSKLDNAHNGWEATMQSPEFADYLQDLSPREKRLALLDLKSGTAENIIEIFDDFKEQGDGDVDKKNTKLDKAKSLSNPTNKKSKETKLNQAKKFLFTRTEINNMSDADYAKQEDAIDQAMANGQIEQR